MRVLWRILCANLLSELAYKTSFALHLLQAFLELGATLVGLSIVFQHTTALNGWRPAHLLVLLGIYILVRGWINLVIQPSMQQLLNDVYKGTLDFTLLQPIEEQFLVSVQRFNIWSVVDIVLGSVLLVGSWLSLGNQLKGGLVILFVITMLAGGVVIYSFWLLLASCAFWCIRIESILAIFQSMYQAGRWPVSIYPTWLRFILTFLVPITLATTFPAEALTGQLSTGNLLLAVIVAALLFFVARLIWLKGLRSYTGASA